MGKSSAELRNALQFELDRQLPWPAAESEVAAWPVKPDASGNASTMVAAARTSSVRQRLDVLDGQRMHLKFQVEQQNALLELHLALEQIGALIGETHDAS